MGSQFDLFLFYCSPGEKFFDFKNTIFRRPFLTPGIFYCDGRMVVDGGWSKKRFSDFSETLHIDSTPKVIFLLFGVLRDNFVMGLKIDF